MYEAVCINLQFQSAALTAIKTNAMLVLMAVKAAMAVIT
jgi:hypothetical protein